ncbi:Panacea domain-containing protein [Micrococcus luteus]|uniref:Panacea domain-containing protein n=1 Tax=Micrococcus luteus TaxID=1270 RepID=UPI003F6DCC6A
MANVHDVAAAVLARFDGPVTTMKLQKLVYFIQEWSFSILNRSMFEEDFRAYVNGPVCYELFDEHRGHFNVREWPEGDAGALSPVENVVVTAVLNNYGALSGKALGDRTHEPGTPWSITREEHGVLPGQPSNAVIRKDLIQRLAPKRG